MKFLVRSTGERLEGVLVPNGDECGRTLLRLSDGRTYLPWENADLAIAKATLEEISRLDGAMFDLKVLPRARAKRRK